jgi:glycosyltransferase involved in cell wall biosynthesis
MVLHHHVSELLRRGHEVQFVTGRDHAALIPLSDYPGLSVQAFDLMDRHKPVRRFRGDPRAYQNFMAAYDGDAILSHMNGGWTSDLLALAERRTTAKRVAVGHGYHRLPFRFVKAGCSFGVLTWAWRVWRARTLAAALRRFDHLVFLADSPFPDKGFYDLWVARRERLPYSIIPNGVEVPAAVADCEVLCRTLGFGDRPFLLNVSNYVEGKHQAEALECFLAADTDAHDLVFIGSAKTSFKADLEWRVNRNRGRLGGRRVFVLDSVPRDLTCAAFRHATLFLLLSDREAQPMVILESMAAGLPYVSRDVGCVREMKGGVLAAGRTEFVAAINQLLGDAALRSSLAVEGLRQARERYDWGVVIDAYERMLYCLVDG